MWDKETLGAIGTLVTGALGAVALLYTAISKGRVEESTVIINGTREEIARLVKRANEAEAATERERVRGDAERSSGERNYAFSVAWWTLAVERDNEGKRRLAILRAQVVELGGEPDPEAADLPPLPATMQAILKGTLQ